MCCTCVFVSVSGCKRCRPAQHTTTGWHYIYGIDNIRYTVGLGLNAWFNDCVLRDCIDAATYGVLLLDLLLRVQMIANPSRNSHLTYTCNQNQSYGTLQESLGQSVSFTWSDGFSIAFLHTQHDRLGSSRSPTMHCIRLVFILHVKTQQVMSGL